MSLVKNWSHDVCRKITQKLSLQETTSALQVLTSPLSPTPVGEVRQWLGPSEAFHLVYVGLTVPTIHLDSHMIFCFSNPRSAIPHFTLDAVKAGEHYAFHLDLIPRVDLAANLSYTLNVYDPLTTIFEKARTIEGLSPAHLSPLQYTVMSPWMLAHRASESAIDCIPSVADQYLDHWLSLINQPTLMEGLYTAEDLEIRDRRHRETLFSKRVDPVWNQVERLLGPSATEKIRQILIGNRNQTAKGEQLCT